MVLFLSNEFLTGSRLPATRMGGLGRYRDGEDGDHHLVKVAARASFWHNSCGAKMPRAKNSAQKALRLSAQGMWPLCAADRAAITAR